MSILYRLKKGLSRPFGVILQTAQDRAVSTLQVSELRLLNKSVVRAPEKCQLL